MIGTLNSAAIERIDRSTKIRSAWTSSGEDIKMSILLILSVSAMPHMLRTDSARASLADQSLSPERIVFVIFAIFCKMILLRFPNVAAPRFA